MGTRGLAPLSQLGTTLVIELGHTDPHLGPSLVEVPCLGGEGSSTLPVRATKSRKQS